MFLKTRAGKLGPGPGSRDPVREAGTLTGKMGHEVGSQYIAGKLRHRPESWDTDRETETRTEKVGHEMGSWDKCREAIARPGKLGYEVGSWDMSWDTSYYATRELRARA